MSARARSNSTRHYAKRGHVLMYERGFRGNGRTRGQKRAKNSGTGGFPAQQPPGLHRGVHIADSECRCGGCSGRRVR